MHTSPVISIITPCYNGEKYLDNYFYGILSQKHRNIELIFINDGSADGTESCALKYGEEMKKCGMRFVYIYQENAGQAAAMNRGLSCFTGEYLTWVDSDDIMLPDNLSKKLSFLENNSDYGMVLNEAEVVDAGNLDKKIKNIKRNKPDGEDHFFEDLIFSRNVVFGPGTILVRRKVVLEAIPSLHIYESREGQNWQMLLPLAYVCKCGYIEEELLKCVSHRDSHSRKKRGIDELFARESNFSILCCETVRNIPSMSSQEKDKWCREIRIHHNRVKLRMSVNPRNYKYYLNARKELETDGYPLKIGDKYVFILFIIGYEKIIRIISQYMQKVKMMQLCQNKKV